MSAIEVVRVAYLDVLEPINTLDHGSRISVTAAFRLAGVSVRPTEILAEDARGVAVAHLLVDGRQTETVRLVPRGDDQLHGVFDETAQVGRTYQVRVEMKASAKAGGSLDDSTMSPAVTASHTVAQRIREWVRKFFTVLFIALALVIVVAIGWVVSWRRQPGQIKVADQPITMGRRRARRVHLAPETVHELRLIDQSDAAAPVPAWVWIDHHGDVLIRAGAVPMPFGVVRRPLEEI